MEWLLKIFKKTLKKVVLDVVGGVVKDVTTELLEGIKINTKQGEVKLSPKGIEEVANKAEGRVQKIIDSKLDKL